jgi:putative heme-binding domain-containing protein
MNSLQRNIFAGLIFSLIALPISAKTFVPTDVGDPDPDVERQSFKIDDNFQITLYASDPMIQKPIGINWDWNGRLWVASSATYPQLVPGQTPNDKVVILEDTTGSGKADKATIFADGLFLPNSVAPGDGGAYVTNSTEIDFLKDTKGSGKADLKKAVLAGFGTEDTHHIVHTLRWGPDGRLYFLQSIYIHSHLETPHGLKTLLGSGVWRYDTRTLDLEVYSRGLVNPWGILWDYWGQTFETDGAGGEGMNYAFPGASFMSAVGMEKVMKGLNPGSPKYCSEEILSGSQMPESYRGDILTNDFRANRIVRFHLSDNGAGYTSKQMPDFLTSTDHAFRPVDIRMGPDGAIYIADWYNPIIQHGEVDFRDHRRDHVHGRIWRVTAKNQPLVEKPKLGGASVPDLLNFLKSSEDWTRNQARLALRERPAAEVLPALANFLRKLKPTDPQGEHDRLEALWVCESINSVDPQLLERVLKSDDPHARAAAVRVVGNWAGQLDNPTALLEPMLKDSYPRVRLEVVRALAQIPSPNSVVLATRVLDLPMDETLDYALWLTCKDLEPVWVPAFQAGKLTNWGHPDHLNFALRAVRSPAALKTLVEQLKSGQTPAQARAGVIDLIGNTGSQPEAEVLFDLALNDAFKNASTRAQMLSALSSMARRKNSSPENPERLIPLLTSGDEAVEAAALRLAGAWKLKAAVPTLIDIAGKPDSSDILRAAAVDGLSRLADLQGNDALRKLSAAPTAMKIRQIAIGGLAAVNVKDAAPRAAEMLSEGPPDPGIVLGGFLSRERGAASLAAALKNKTLPSDTAKLALRYLRNTTTVDPSLSDVLSAAAGSSSGPIKLSPEQMKQTMDEVAAKGNAANGERIFRRAETACYTCHAISGIGGWLAPDLSSVGASAPMDYLVNAVLDPNKDIKDGFDGFSIITKSGDAYSGIKVSQDHDRLVLRDNTHLEMAIPMSEIKAQKSIGSLMPNGLSDRLTHQEFLDLIRFLSELGKPGPYATTPTQYLRRWRQIDATPTQLNNLDSAMPALAANEGVPVYSLVSGILPDDAMVPPGKSLGLVRSEINVTSAGSIRLVLNNAKGVRLWIDGKPVNVTGEQVTADPTTGIHDAIFAVDLASHGPDGLRVEVVDVPGSTAHAQPVGGK